MKLENSGLGVDTSVIVKNSVKPGLVFVSQHKVISWRNVNYIGMEVFVKAVSMQ